MWSADTKYWLHAKAEALSHNYSKGLLKLVHDAGHSGLEGDGTGLYKDAGWGGGGTELARWPGLRVSWHPAMGGPVRSSPGGSRWWGTALDCVLCRHPADVKSVPVSDMEILRLSFPQSRNARKGAPRTEVDRCLQRIVGGRFTLCQPSQGGGRWLVVMASWC